MPVYASVVVKRKLWAFGELSPSSKERVLDQTIAEYYNNTPQDEMPDKIKTVMEACGNKKDEVVRMMLKWNYKDFDCITKLLESRVYSDFGDVAYAEVHSEASPLMFACWDNSERYKEHKM